MEQHFPTNFSPIFQPSVMEVEQQSLQQQAAMSAISPPSTQPWTIEDMPWAQHRNPTPHSHLIQFEACATLPTILHAKRKPDKPTSTPPAKQFITEEKISAHFNGLTISNSFTANAGSISMDDDFMPAACSNEAYRATAKELEEKLKNANQIKICEDVLKMYDGETKTPLLPYELINRIETPLSKALVVWQPPAIIELLKNKITEDLKKSTKDACKQNQTNEKSNNTSQDIINDVEFSVANEFDDFIDNNNTCNADNNNIALMDEDL